MLPKLLSLTLLALAFLLTSCLDGDEEIWLKRDGSGRLEATYRMPGKVMEQFGSAPVLKQTLAEAFAKEPSIHVEHIGHGFEDGRVVFEFRADFDDVRTLAAFPKKHLRDPGTPDTPGSEETLFGVMELALSGLTLSFDRTVDLSGILPEAARNNPGLLGASAFRYTVHLPSGASKHNAHTQTDNGRTLGWEFPLREFTDAPMLITLKAPLPIPWWIWITGALLIALVLFLLVLATRRILISRR